MEREAETVADRPVWRVTAAGSIGAHHLTVGLPYQDAVASVPPVSNGSTAASVILAVADGHGHPRHFRSDRGARFAVSAACAIARKLLADIALADAPTVEQIATKRLAPRVLRAWRKAVSADLETDPVGSDELRPGAITIEQAHEEPFVAYGSTLVLGVLTGAWLVCVQIGDGDLLGVRQDGQTLTPVPGDPNLAGDVTTSLCQSDAAKAFRFAVVDQRSEPLMALMLATDGYGNAQLEDPWQPGVGADMARFIRERGGDWVVEHLPEWAARCASSEGSGDDVTIALAFDRELAETG